MHEQLVDTTTLPIDAILDDVAEQASANTRLVIEAPPGAGKTTRVPPALLRALPGNGQIWVAQPRRIAAKLMAHHVAAETRQKLGALVGYTVRFDDCTSQQTRLRYVTSGILLRRLLSDPYLRGIDCVVLDEFHERHLDTDLALALVSHAQNHRPDLRLVVMSATLDGARLSEVLGGCPRLTSTGRLYPTTIEFDATVDERPIEKRVSSALRRLAAQQPQGSTLVFLPGAAEIRRTRATIAPLCEQLGWDIAVLHGDLPLEEQTRAITPGARPRVVLTTNIAESAITVEGVTAVVDSGLARQKDSSSFSGLSRLTVQKISRASAIQRAGRAGRTAPGQVIRLFTRGDYDTRPEFETPEILRVELSEALLMLYGVRHRPANPVDNEARGQPKPITSGTADSPLVGLLLVDVPVAAAVESARSLLLQLGAIDISDRPTPLGRRLLDIPLHPRLARLLIECEGRGIGQLGALAAALLSERDLRATQYSTFEQRASERGRILSGDSDITALVELYLEARDARWTNGELRERGIDPTGFRSVQRAYEHLRRVLRTDSRLELDAPAERELGIALLVAFPDRVAKRRTADGNELVLRSGATARLADTTVVTKPLWLIAIDAEERREPGRRSGTIVRIASAIQEDWLLDVLSHELVSDEEFSWVAPPGRVEIRSRIRLGSLLVEESRRLAKPGHAVAALLRNVIVDAGWLKCDELTRLGARLDLVAKYQNVKETPAAFDPLNSDLLTELLNDRVDLDGLDGPSLASHLVAHLPGSVGEALRTLAPEAVMLPHGRRCTVQYEAGKTPWIASRLQDFFGLSDSPTILGGRLKLVIHLLAPNQRAVQITDDLRGFWATHYPDIRRQLQRRYPRHSWPEDGQTARPPEPRPAHRQR